ncbi:MAG: hypothetical protein A3G33_05690 [Omnitrophica bacterium RIFCSPLOWO2_12_FULL_44_17]|uniref:histidine kinase n=1 Tax=Candidatus Danuiimicrobium aquiferis TaxID=1801832 RepID=A0A1G1L332_9BACT|nr:MAG: hypothetical protein A3B72_05170 [Omnitrophica bacterium RIFCSPHIGHO2_02_FULL_45_28]OGW89893.1 MAG: hypothetical protein A3E74_01840 [Omnitrophica bacterium RIFCSPHIGHO2_12_FULL_44_12]OGW99563.1 MAG: hypothetical protein A3G33_05690 [Omnitrophica bacterium RIFCSPLOWO2_12_FULL_44_17]OGX04012.1 MAG: hypothetical protein A3J12_06230 [Omnitrophica bacterium RIFCSPLOWO2_02_FULL_44_11]
MGRSEASQNKKKKNIPFFPLIIFVGMLFTVTLWDAYLHGTDPLGRELVSSLILIMGTLFSISAGLFSWSIESRRGMLERQVNERTRELNEKNQELAEKNQEIEQFIHTISHDLKAPIVSIQGFASILKSELGSTLNEGQTNYFSRILTNLKYMNSLIADLLELSRIGRIEEEKEEVDTIKVLEGLVAELKPEMDRRRVTIELKTEFPKFFGSRKRLEQVFLNLLGNAVKYIGTPECPKIEVGCSESRKSGFSEIWIRDNGIGIKKEYQEKIFQMFQRAPESIKEEGTGIGLNIVKKIVELNGGAVWVESEPGKGSTFFFEWTKACGTL